MSETVTVTATFVDPITEPGVYDIPDAAYHADPVPGGSLSRSGAKLLLPPSCPARFAYEREHGRTVHKKEWDIGHAAHKMVLGTGPELVLVDRERWDTKAVKQEVADIYARGAVPLKRDDYETAQAMATALRQHPTAAALFNPDRGKPEQSLFWRGGDICLRARLDWLPDPGPGRMVVPDYKTADSAHPDSFRRDAARYSYHLQAAWYTAAVDNVLDIQCAFVFVVQEKTPPYLVTVIELDQQAVRAGHDRMRRAIEIYRDCTESGIWPGYALDTEIPLVSLPAYATRDLEENW